MQKTNTAINFGINDAPFSADTLEYDYFVHHQVFRSVLGSLVSTYSKGAITPFLAEEWSHEDNKRKWKFKIRKNIIFDNGDEITPEIIYKSFCRMAFLQLKKNSNSGLLEYLEGFQDIKDIQKCRGISYTEDEVVFTFSKPLENLLETIAFGQYAIVHPNDYDANGDWKDPKKVASSSFYSISEWIDGSIKLRLRENFNLTVGHKNKAKEINVYWNKDENLDIKKTTSLDNVPSDWTYLGGALSNIIFLRVTSWRQKKFLLSSKNTRQLLRSKVYKYLNANGYNITSSFFPKGIEGIKEIEIPDITKNDIHQFSNLTFSPFRDPPGKIGLALTDALKSLNFNIANLSSPEKYETLEPNLESYKADVLAMGTGILIDKPDDDVRFMFMSKEGIRLPDETGEILSLLQKDSLDLQAINELIFDQAIIWPITHYSDGLIVNSRIDTSILNTIYPPIDFAFIGLK